MTTQMEFEAKDRPLSDVFFANRRYAVPRYQRPYTWGDENLNEFWEDLTKSADPYFFGSMIFNTEQEKERGYLDIIDGQQRLLTVTILAAALRDQMMKLDQDTAKRYQVQDIAPLDRKGSWVYRIIPSDALKDYFQKYIQSPENNISDSIPQTPEEKQVKHNYLFFQNELTSGLARLGTNEAQRAWIDDLRNRIADLIVISIEIDREENAYEIFETTNARGVELSVADLLKNLVFKNIRAGTDRDFAKEVWQEICKNIELTGTDLKKFIRYHWISKYSFTPEKKLFRAIKTKVTDWNSLLQDLWDDSSIYNRLLESGEEDFQDLKHGAEIYASLSGLRLMGVSQCYVLFLSILRHMRKLGTDPYRIFQLIEKFTFQYSVICKLPANRLERIYSKFGLDIDQAVSQVPEKRVPGRVQAVFAELRKELLNLAPEEAVFKAQFKNVTYGNSEEDRKLISYILSMLEDHFAKTGEKRTNFNVVNIEHILPRNPSKNWKLTKKEIKGYVDKLGNLTLLSEKINSQVQNGTIDEKLPCYKGSTLFITQELVKALALKGRWGEAEILERQMDLADIAYNHVWKLSNE